MFRKVPRKTSEQLPEQLPEPKLPERDFFSGREFPERLPEMSCRRSLLSWRHHEFVRIGR